MYYSNPNEKAHTLQESGIFIIKNLIQVFIHLVPPKKKEVPFWQHFSGISIHRH